MLMMEMTLTPVMIIGSHKQRRRRGRWEKRLLKTRAVSKFIALIRCCLNFQNVGENFSGVEF